MVFKMRCHFFGLSFSPDAKLKTHAQDDALCNGVEDGAAKVAAVCAVVVVSFRHRSCVGGGSAATTQRLRTRWCDNAKRGGATISASAREGAMIPAVVAWAHGNC